MPFALHNCETLWVGQFCLIKYELIVRMDVVKKDMEMVGVAVEEAGDKARWSAVASSEGSSRKKKKTYVDSKDIFLTVNLYQCSFANLTLVKKTHLFKYEMVETTAIMSLSRQWRMTVCVCVLI